MTLVREIKESPASKLRSYAESGGNSYYVNGPIDQHPASLFVKMIVLDVVFDPNKELTDPKRVSYWVSLGIDDTTHARVLPRNTIIGKIVNSDHPAMFVFPFFPSHISMPCKPGECVWALFEDNKEMTQIAYWFCRVPEIHIADDVNHTHPVRSLDPSAIGSPSHRERFEKSGSEDEYQKFLESIAWHELRNSPVRPTSVGPRESARTNRVLKDKPDDIFEQLVEKSDASRLIAYESVPRFRKRPGDLVLEGTNNTLISLGYDRGGPVADYITVDNPVKSFIPQLPDTDLRGSAGAIDIVAGRGQTSPTFGKQADTTRIIDSEAAKKKKGSSIKKELNKSLIDGVQSKQEGDPDFTNDRSRLLISQRTKVDTKFNLSDYSKKFGISDASTGDSSIVIKTDKVRIIARSDMQLIVSNFTNLTSADDQSIKQEEKNMSKWASITIKTNGDIVITPSDSGFIKLGGEDASLGVVCTPGAPIPSPGLVPGGSRSTKVLIK